MSSTYNVQTKYIEQLSHILGMKSYNTILHTVEILDVKLEIHYSLFLVRANGLDGMYKRGYLIGTT
jgi:hypothetical protein